MGLNPAVILLALSVWGTLLGILGMVIALPATTIIIKWLKIWLVSIDREHRLKSRMLIPPEVL